MLRGGSVEDVAELVDAATTSKGIEGLRTLRGVGTGFEPSLPLRECEKLARKQFRHGIHEDIFDRSVDAQILRLRRKSEADPSHPTLIRTERGAGYIFTARVLVS
jgi:hypothetical protein